MTMKFSAVSKLCFCLALAVALTGCGGVKKGGGDVSAASSASLSSSMEYFLFGLRQIQSEDISGAAETLDEMEIRYPLNIETGELYSKLIEGYYNAGQADQVIELANRFTTMFPSHKNVVQAHYYAGMADYDRGRQNISMDVHTSDPTYAKTALARFYTLLKCCDNNEYAHNAKQYIYHLESMISLYELRYMEWDYDAGRINAAAQRGMSLKLTYPDSVAAKRATMMLSSAVFNKHGMAIDKATAVKFPVADVVSVKTTVPEPVVMANVSAPVSVAAVAATPASIVPMTESKPVVAEKFYAIQMMSLSTLDGLKNMVNSMGLSNDVALYSHVVKGKTYYISLYGKYPNWSTGKTGLAELEQRTGKTGYWLRKIDSSKIKIVD